MATTRPVPSPTQIRAYLTAHGWRKGWDIPEAGEMFVFEEPADNGEEITVFVPMHELYEDYPHGVNSVVDTLEWIERRPKEVVWADLCGTGAVNGTVAPTGTTASDTSPQAAN